MADETPNPHPILAAPPADESQKPITEKGDTPEPPSNKQEPTPEPPLPASQSSSMEPEKENRSPSELVVVDSEPIVTTQKEETFTEVVTEVPDVKDATLVVEKEETLSKTVTEASDLKEKEKEKEVLFADDSVELKSNEGDKEKKIPQSLVSFKEESNKVADLSDSERKALQELKQLVQDALNSNQLVYPKKPSSDTTTATEPPNSESKIEENPVKEAEEVAKEAPKAEAFVEEVSIWGVPLLKDDRSDVILLKFLRARDFKVKEAYVMLRNTLSWRKEFGIDGLLDEDLGDDLDKVVFMHGYDKEGHPVCYNVFGEFQNKELYHKTFSDDEKRTKFLRWRIQFLERSIRKLDFSPGGVCSIFQVNDLKNSPGPGKRELRLATKHALQLLQDNYPEFVAKQVFINVPWWYLAFYTMISPFLTQRTKSKFVFAGPQKSPQTLFKYISPEHVPIQYGGLSVDDCDCNPEFSVSDPVTEVNIKPGTKQIVEIIIYEKCVIVWELRVVGWEVSYRAEFAPNTEGGYSIIIQKPVKMAPNDEPVVHNSFKVAELGKIFLTINNPTSKRKKLLYRFNIKPISD